MDNSSCRRCGEQERFRIGNVTAWVRFGDGGEPGELVLIDRTATCLKCGYCTPLSIAKAESRPQMAKG
jgi:hypothetical protein